MGLGIATGAKCSAAVPLVVSYLGTNGSGLSIGPARSDRYIVAIGYSENDAAGSISSCLFDGVAGTIVFAPTMSDTFSMSYKQVTSGTSVTVSISQFGLVRTEFYMVTGTKVGYYGGSANTSGGTSLTISNGTPAADCAIIMGSRSRGSSGSFAASVSGGSTGMTLDHGFNHAGGGNPACWASSGYGDKSGVAVHATHSGSSAYSSGWGGLLIFQ
jgi:hypothetical protein